MSLLSAPPPSRYYWRMQALAWALYGVLNAVMFRAFVPKTADTPMWVFDAMSFTIAATALGASHLLRQLIWQGRWLARAPLALLGRLLGAVAALAVGSVGVIGLISALVLPSQATGRGPQGWGAQLGYSLNLAILLSLWAAAYVGWCYLQRSRRAEIEKWRLTAAVREAELNTLRAQLNPHFLFNGLNNIRGLVSEDPARARQALAHLAELLRYVMQHSATPWCRWGRSWTSWPITWHWKPCSWKTGCGIPSTWTPPPGPCRCRHSRCSCWLKTPSSTA